jgi:signal transduction histidine kinase/CheY-like chemotaxis protein
MQSKAIYPSDSEDHNQPRAGFLHRYSRIAALFVVLAGIAITYTVVQIELSHAHLIDDAHFAELVEELEEEVSRRVMVYRYGMMGTRSVFAASDYVDYDEFIRLVGARELESEFPGALGIGYIERVPHSDEAMASFVEQVREDDAPWFDITIPPGSEPLDGALTDDRYIIKYIEPLSANKSAHGLDIGAHPVRREAAERGIVSADGTMTGIIQLVQDNKQMAGFLYLLPFFKQGVPLDTVEQRADALMGWVYMPLLGPKVFEGLDEIIDRELDMHVYDGEDLVGSAMIYDADGHIEEDSEIFFHDYAAEPGERRATLPIEIGGRTWTLAVRSAPTFKTASRSEAWLIGVMGSCLTLLISTLVFVQGTSTRKAWSIAEGMTADLREYASKAEQATQAKSDFLANMSHEIRTPMTAILGFTDLLRAQIDQDNQELVAHTKTIKRNGEHLLSLINDILDMSKIEAGKLNIEQIAVAPDNVVCEVLSLMRVKAEEKKLPLSAELLTPVPRKIVCDPVRLRQILVNLVGNAIKFTEQGGVSIEVRYDEHMEELKFAVTDTGVGLTNEQVSRLFGAFEQADETTTRQFGGTGLGLHISQRLSTMLGGNITCNSTYGQGSTFTLTVYTGTVDSADLIPAGSIEDLPAAQKNEQPATTQDSNNTPLQGMKILLAEDGKDNQRLINHHLTKAGAEVTIVENGKLAVEALCVDGEITGPLKTNPPFDLVITDMQMPEMDGYTEATLLRQKGCTMPIIALTAHAMKEDVKKCLDAGCDYYASKPVNKQVLIDTCVQAYEAREISPDQRRSKSSAA